MSVMNQRHERGRLGEQFAIDYFRARSYLLCAQRYRTSEGEVDLIVQRDHLLVFVEVKTRTSDAFGNALEAVNSLKLHRLLKVAEAYRHRYNWRGLWRIDVVTVQLTPEGHFKSIDHYEDVTQ